MSVRIACRRSSALCVLLAWLGTAHSRVGGVESRQPLHAWFVSGALSALRDQNDEIKVFALSRLGELKEPRTAETIAEFLKTKYSSSVRLAALKAYAALHVRDSKHLPEIAAYLVSTSAPSWSEMEQVGAAVEAISAMGADRQYKSKIAQLVHPSAVRPINSGVLLGLAKGGSLREYRPQVLALFEMDGGSASQVVEASGLAADYLPQLRSILKGRISVPEAFTGQGLLPSSEAQEVQGFVRSYYASREQLARRAAWDAISSAHLARSFLPQIQHALTSGLHQGTSHGEDLAGALRAIVSEDLDQTYAASIHRALDRHFGQRFLAIAALASGGAAARYGWEIKQALPFTPWDSRSDRAEAIKAVAATGLAPFHQVIADTLSGNDLVSKASALRGIAQAGTVGQYMQEINSLLKSNEVDYVEIREGILRALASGQCDLDYMVTLVAPLAYTAPWETSAYRFALYSCGGGGKDATLAAALLPRGARHTISGIVSGKDDRQRAFTLFEHFARLPGLPYPLQAEISARLADLAELIPWSEADLKHLRTTYKLLYGGGFHADAGVLEKRILDIEGRQTSKALLNTALRVLALHTSFWFAMIVLYPRSRMVQAIFFWNPWVRRILGFGYVGFLLTWVPFLRSRLLAPFRDSLLADARLGAFSKGGYFAGSTMRDVSTGKSAAVSELIRAPFVGQVVIEGESGLGKTMLLRYVALTARRSVAFLLANSCAGGVLEAVQEKLKGKASDPVYLRNLIWAGAMDIYIDGLNEVTADTRAIIARFMADYSKGNIVVATQALEWSPPGTARIYVLQPLDSSCIRAFLEAREALLPEDSALRGEAYHDECTRFLAETLSPHRPPEDLLGATRVLSNPMDLTTVAEMIARGKSPDLFHLQEQQYDLMQEDFVRTNNRPFPLRNFAGEIYRMRMDDRRELKPGIFDAALYALERFKLVLRREEKSGEPVWLFRHDRVMDFFLVQAFLGVDNTRPKEHLTDPRFSGVYLMLAFFLPYNDALNLRELLLQSAADSKDHIVSDSFIQLLRTRRSGQAA